MFKKTHIISYIQQVGHKWIEGNEEETTYAQATESLRVVPIDIQHRPKVLKRFKAAHEPLVKVVFSFENMESHGELIKTILLQLQPSTNLCSWIVENPIHQVLQTHFPIPFHVFPTTLLLWETISPRKKETMS
jgi:hypothetical protein